MSNTNTAQKPKIVQIEVRNLQTTLKQFEGQKKAKNALNS